MQNVSTLLSDTGTDDLVKFDKLFSQRVCCIIPQIGLK